LAVIVANILARWSTIEHHVSLLLLHVLGAEAKPALAMFSVLTTDRLQTSALMAAAKAKLTEDEFAVFKAALGALDCIKNDRHRLAHWLWGTCPELPDHLLLVNPEHLRQRDIRREEFKATVTNHLLLEPDRMKEFYGYDLSEIQAYSKEDLERVKRDFSECTGMMVMLQVYLKPYLQDDDPIAGRIPMGTRAEALDALLRQRLFRESLDRAKATKNTPGAISE
jgi:hypothetical protein